MNNFDFLQKYQKLQHTIMFDELVDLSFAMVGYSKTDPFAYWSLALTDRVLDENQILEIEGILKQHQRNSTIYFENKDELNLLKEGLGEKGYKKNFEDSWQFWSGGEKLDNQYFNSVKKVSDKTSLRIFLEAFNQCYQKNDPQNPYGELGSDYLKVAEEVWQKHNQRERED